MKRRRRQGHSGRSNGREDTLPARASGATVAITQVSSLGSTVRRKKR